MPWELFSSKPTKMQRKLIKKNLEPSGGNSKDLGEIQEI